MEPNARTYHVACSSCDFQQYWGIEAVARALIRIGKLRPTAEFHPDIFCELFKAHRRSILCPSCGESRMAIREARREEITWDDAVRCEECGKEIPAARLEAVPGTTVCVGCLERREKGVQTPEHIEYCPRCGSPMELRPDRSSGITRYVSTCTARPACRGKR
jgi:ssDNA-binding Zn-finger/Zn-ribbon topoisomerase 1